MYAWVIMTLITAQTLHYSYCMLIDTVLSCIQSNKIPINNWYLINYFSDCVFSRSSVLHMQVLILFAISRQRLHWTMEGIVRAHSTAHLCGASCSNMQILLIMSKHYHSSGAPELKYSTLHINVLYFSWQMPVFYLGEGAVKIFPWIMKTNTLYSID